MLWVTKLNLSKLISVIVDVSVSIESRFKMVKYISHDKSIEIFGPIGSFISSLGNSGCCPTSS